MTTIAKVYCSDLNYSKPDTPGGFKFQVQRVNDGATARRLPAAWQSLNICGAAYSADGQWHSTHAAYSPTGPCLWVSTDAAAHSYSHWSRAARAHGDPQSRRGLRVVERGAQARPSLCPDHTSVFSAMRQGSAGASWYIPGTPSRHPCHPYEPRGRAGWTAQLVCRQPSHCVPLYGGRLPSAQEPDDW